MCYGLVRLWTGKFLLPVWTENELSSQRQVLARLPVLTHWPWSWYYSVGKAFLYSPPALFLKSFWTKSIKSKSTLDLIMVHQYFLRTISYIGLFCTPGSSQKCQKLFLYSITYYISSIHLWMLVMTVCTAWNAISSKTGGKNEKSKCTVVEENVAVTYWYKNIDTLKSRPFQQIVWKHTWSYIQEPWYLLFCTALENVQKWVPATIKTQPPMFKYQHNITLKYQ